MDAANLGVAAALDGSTARLRVRGLGKRFGRHVVLDGVDLDVHSGELVALVGENGAGKSTLVQCVAGTLAPDRGSVTVAGGGDVDVAVVWQDLALCENLDVIGNLFLGRERAAAPLFGRLRRLRDAAMEAEAVRTLQGLSVRIPSVHQPVATLSGGQRQSVAVARAVLWGSRLVLMDEPTAAWASC